MYILNGRRMSTVNHHIFILYTSHPDNTHIHTTKSNHKNSNNNNENCSNYIYSSLRSHCTFLVLTVLFIGQFTQAQLYFCVLYLFNKCLAGPHELAALPINIYWLFIMYHNKCDCFSALTTKSDLNL